MTWTVLGIAATSNLLYALRGDGAVFVLVGKLNNGDSYWAACPAVPGTEAAKEQEG